jgi:hypothetical protein
MPVSVKITGLERAADLLRLLGDAAQAVGRERAVITSTLPYAYWIEEGHYAGGRPGRRRAGPARMFEAGVATLERLAPDAVARNAERGPDAVRRGLSGVYGEATKQVRARTPVVTGGLRDSIHTTTGFR